MIINVHAGHNPDGMVACGAIGFIKESTEARIVKDKVINQLKALGHTVYDCTCNNGTSQKDILNKIVAKCNEHTVDLDVSIHFNSSASSESDGLTTGTEVLVYSMESKSLEYAKNICKQISELGFRNRGVKERPKLKVLNSTKSPALLIECCFVNDPDDIAIYNADKMANQIVMGIVGNTSTVVNKDRELLSSMTKEQFVDYIGNLAREDMKKTGILASITTAQAILESAYGKSELALNALNLGGMKANLSGNNWKSDWDGQIYRKETSEQLDDGSYISIYADFRKYNSISDYLKDHSDYLSYAKNGNKLRYEGIVGCKDYEKGFQIIKDGGYATSHDYVKNLRNVVEKWNLTRFDTDTETNVMYVVSCADVWTLSEAEKVKDTLNLQYPLLPKVIHKVQIL